jgi:hypothetical protein
MGSRQAASRRWAQLPPSSDEPYRLDVRREPVAAGHDGDSYSLARDATLKPDEKKTQSRPANKAHQLRHKNDKGS